MAGIRSSVFDLYIGARRRLHGYGLTRVPGVTGLRDSLFRTLTSDESAEIPTKEGRFLVNKTDQGIVPSLLATGEYDPAFTSLMKQCLRPGMRVVDIGANFGFYTVVASQRVGSAGEVYSFEPDPENHRLLVHNIALNGCENVRPFPIAIGEKAGLMQLYRDPTNLGNHSLCSENTGCDGSESVPITVRPLDSILPDLGLPAGVDFIKIDVQGAEGAVIKGASRILSTSRPRILMEFWPKGLENFGAGPLDLLLSLRDLQFEISVVDSELRRVPPDGLAALSTLSSYPDRDHVDLLLSKRESDRAAGSHDVT